MINPAPVSMITTVRNEVASILALLESYRQQTKHASEFIIVDGGSTDGTIEAITGYAASHPKLNICLVTAPECSPAHTLAPIARARNLAIQKTSHEIIAVTDAGCVLHPDWLVNITAPLNHADIVAGWYQYNVKSPFQSRYACLMEPNPKTINPKTVLPSSRSIAFKKSCWRAIGGYPELSYSGEDTFFDIKLHRAGYAFAFEPMALVYWTPPQTFTEAIKKHRWYSYGDGQLHLRKFLHFSRMLCLLFPCFLLIDRRKRKHFFLAYCLTGAQVIGFVMGFLSSVRRFKARQPSISSTH